MGTDPSHAYQSPSAAFGREGVDTRAVFGQTMGLVAFALGFFALGAYIGRDLSPGTALIIMLAGLVPLIAMNFAVKRANQQLAILLLFAFGLMFGLGLGPVLNEYVQADQAAVWQAGGATALFVAALGSFGYATKRDFSSWGRALFWALLAFIAFGLVAIFVSIPAENIIWSVLGLILFGFLTIFDFNRLKRSGMEMAPLIAASIFLDVINIFLFFLSLFGGNRN